MQYFPGSVLFSTELGIYLAVSSAVFVVAPPETTAPVGAVAVAVADVAAHVSAASAAAAVQSAPVLAAAAAFETAAIC